jgi:UDP-N-acetylglucosamine--N-acetylmuramyl-(pentapeptide) pyrophosphoryl-undecaprenol N-acetylglucosamine transferase
LKEKIPGIHIIHQTGERDYNDAQARYLSSGVAAEVSPFIDDMPATFARADLVVCRSGASTVAEITAAGKLAIFVPFPRAADDHQRVNAEALAQAGAAVVLEESSLTPATLVQNIVALMRDRNRLEKMSAAARKLAHPHAAGEIAQMAARLAGKELVVRSQ